LLKRDHLRCKAWHLSESNPGQQSIVHKICSICLVAFTRWDWQTFQQLHDPDSL